MELLDNKKTQDFPFPEMQTVMEPGVYFLQLSSLMVKKLDPGRNYELNKIFFHLSCFFLLEGDSYQCVCVLSF